MCLFSRSFIVDWRFWHNEIKSVGNKSLNIHIWRWSVPSTSGPLQQESTNSFRSSEKNLCSKKTIRHSSNVQRSTNVQMISSGSQGIYSLYDWIDKSTNLPCLEPALLGYSLRHCFIKNMSTMTKETEKAAEKAPPVVKYSQLYRFASARDKVLMAAGSVFAIIMGKSHYLCILIHLHILMS
jgi:hypothetical protein